ncbi:MAG: FeoB-associated Cys-rich membrane protein [Acetanaerobacterium sp.]
MFEFVAQNFATILIGAVVFGILAAVVIKIIKDHRNHKPSCGCGCENCPSSGMCHHD